MNWFGLFTLVFGVLMIAVIFAIEYGYEQAEKDWTMSKEWLDRLEMENDNWSNKRRSMHQHPTNKDWN